MRSLTLLSLVSGCCLSQLAMHAALGQMTYMGLTLVTLFAATCNVLTVIVACLLFRKENANVKAFVAALVVGYTIGIAGGVYEYFK